MIKKFSLILTSALVVTGFAAGAMAQVEVDIMDPWKRDRAAHQERIDAQLKSYEDRWPEHLKERYPVDGVGVIDKEGARAEYDAAHAPQKLEAEASDAVEENTEQASEIAPEQAENSAQ